MEEQKQHKFLKKEGGGGGLYPGTLASGKPLSFPYLTFEKDDNYLKFMTLIMRSLESRYFIQHDVIHKELDECHEVLFIMEGKYNIGYEINKKRHFR